jgi:hypothetical protein
VNRRGSSAPTTGATERSVETTTALAGDAGEELVGWAAGLALRHRACVVGDADESRLWAADRMAHAAGMRLIDLATSPAPVTQRLPH